MHNKHPLTAADLTAALDDTAPVKIAVGSGWCITATAEDLRILMGRWGTDGSASATRIRLMVESGEYVARCLENDHQDWLFSVACPLVDIKALAAAYTFDLGEWNFCGDKENEARR